ncbi:MAG: hypothetical protein LBS41_03530 [Streptococcaceae bacterium]|nr:hypothetical protein [Streptococcaceae bacterium]
MYYYLIGGIKVVESKEGTPEQMDLWVYYKMIREERGYTYGEIACDFLHRSQLSRFEKGKNMFSAECLLAAIKGLNMTPEEFFALMPNHSPNQIHVFNAKMREYVMANDLEGMKSLLKPRAKKKIDRIHNLMIKVALLDTSGEDLMITSDRQFVRDYLDNIKQWTQFEVYVLGLCLKAFDDDDIYDLALDMIKSNDLSRLVASHEELVKKTLLNIYVYFICMNRYEYSRKIKAEIESLINEWDMEAKIILHIFGTFATFKQKDSPELLDEIQGDIQVLKKFGVTGLADRLVMFMKRYR